MICKKDGRIINLKYMKYDNHINKQRLRICYIDLLFEDKVLWILTTKQALASSF